VPRVLDGEGSELREAEELTHPRDVHHDVVPGLDVPVLQERHQVRVVLLELGLDHHQGLATLLDEVADGGGRLRQEVLLRPSDDEDRAVGGDRLLAHQEDALDVVEALGERALDAGEAPLPALLAAPLALALDQAHRLLPLAGDLDEGVRDVLLAVVRDALALVGPLHDEDRPRAPHVVGLRLRRALHRVHELHLQLRGERLVLLQAVLAPLHVALALEVRDLDVVLEPGQDLPRLVGEAVSLVLREVEALRVAAGQVVRGAQEAQDDGHEHEGVRSVLELPAAEAPRHVLPAQDEVEEDEGEGGDQVGAQPAGERLAVARPAEGADGQDEAEGREVVDESLQEAHAATPSTAGSPPTGGRGRGRR
jgi:hypothetical protein